MAKAYLRFLLVAFALILSSSCIHGGRNSARKGTIKTIHSTDGDIIDCVDIYKQPAFDHPLLKNHKIQIELGFIPSQWNQEKQESVVRQTWHESGECPEGTIPIRRSTTSTPVRRSSTSTPVRRSTSSLVSSPFPYSIQPNFSFRGEPYEYAVAFENHAMYRGASAKLNVWNPRTNENERSSAQIWLVAGYIENINTVEVGWAVDPERYGDHKTRLFVYWTTTSYRQGCFDLECPGFVQLSPKYALGTDLHPLSSYEGPQYEINIFIIQNLQTGNWYLKFQDVILGYWPGSLMQAMKNGAAGVQWGGQVTNLRSGDRHTTTQMGSGYFTPGGFQKASFVKKMEVISNGVVRDPENIDTQVSNVFCYDLHVAIRNDDNGFYFYYGGPGYGTACTS
ncbi:protein neprosin-like [Malania oleifera]|uniref:protein neprosin-like n=1 Tax=Malania oleifera TaxID=397392 RepID=UPI0025AE18A9|nr:protein neprosin-like [Malania oleifera]